MAELQLAHTHNVEIQALTASVGDAKDSRIEAMRGQFCALAIGIVGLGIAPLIMHISPNSAGATVASIVGGSTILGMVTAFILGRRSERPAEAEGATKPAASLSTDLAEQTDTDHPSI